MNATAEQLGLSLPGYTLSTRLGAGGYGEVWLAEAPGGLTKAVKFIYGSYHERRAEHEFRALQRIKEVRHPFLLSLERIEIIDGRLVIVTELADSSLKDRFDRCREQGLAGVPRAELLKYLRDAADALDFLSERHALQHLDVKPENLLLVAGHVKVADFGLVKDVGASQASLVGGLTPLYSAPEVFQGAPSSHSDQYSLAVLYQEMLTGSLPFSGLSAAELTLQHLHDEPDLSVLPTADRYVLARALAKEPTQRFARCSELIEALLAAEGGGGEGWGAAEADRGSVDGGHAEVRKDFAPSQRGPVTELFDAQLQGRPKEISKSMLLDWSPPASRAPTSLPPLDISCEDFRAQPTLIVGVGGTAASVLKQLRLRMARQFGDEPLPSVQMLLLDSDPKTIARALQGEARSALAPNETLALPLRRPQEYREQSTRLMRWLSRRWLYNIPRSLKTDGLRPLGRLALADHARQAVQRIRMALAQATDAEALVTSEERTGLAFHDGTARVYVIASISGGTGSGMSLDVGYAVRVALEKAGIGDAQVTGVFLHSTGSEERHCDLAKVNAYAWLTEYNHFHRPGGEFPGDESCGLPAPSGGRRAFDSAYLVDLGAALQDDDLEQAAQAVAEYVYLDALTPAQGFFDQCRREPHEHHSGEATLRTFNVHKVAASADASIDAAAAMLSREVVLQWVGTRERAARGPAIAGGAEPAPPASVHDTNQLVKGAATLVSQLQLNLEGLASNARAFIEAQFGGDQTEFLISLLDAAREEGKPLAAGDVLRRLDGLFLPPADGGEAACACVLQRPLDAIVSPLTMKLAGDLGRWVMGKLDDRQERLAGAQLAAAWLVDHVQCLEGDADRLAAALTRQIAATADDWRHDGRAAAADAAARALAYFRMRIDQHAVWAASIIMKRLLSELKSVGATIAEFGRHLRHVALSLPGGPERTSPAKDPLAASLAQQLPALSEAIDQQIQREFVDENGGLFQTIMGNSRVRAQMLAAMTKIARRAVQQLASQPEIVRAAFSSGEAASASGAQSCRDAIPELLKHGGSYRRLTVAPDGCVGHSMARSEESSREASSVLTGVGQEMVVCCEGWNLPLARVAVDLIQSRRDYADFATRVLTRSDVAWTPLTAPRPPAVACENAFSDQAPMTTQVL